MSNTRRGKMSWTHRMGPLVVERNYYLLDVLREVLWGYAPLPRAPKIRPRHRPGSVRAVIVGGGE